MMSFKDTRASRRHNYFGLEDLIYLGSLWSKDTRVSGVLGLNILAVVKR